MASDPSISEQDEPSWTSRNEFVATMRNVPSSVAVASSRSGKDRLAMTVGTFIPVSADPPMVLISVSRRTLFCRAVLQSGAFTVNILSSDQAGVADRFAGRPRAGRAYDLTQVEWHESESEGEPFLCGAAASFACILEHTLEIATHALLIGRVKATHAEDRSPLIHFSRRYAFAVLDQQSL